MTLHQHIRQTLAYFDVFRYPVTLQEIHLYCGRQISSIELQQTLYQMVLDGSVMQHGEWYALSADPTMAYRRASGNHRADALIPLAYRIGRLLYRFPFIKAVGISGSLSKHYAEEDADIDFFIITAPGRLWIARTLLHLLKKISYLLGKEHWFCMNYFIDTDALLIAEQNRFTATEIVSLLPVKGESCFEKFYSANRWVEKELPNAELAWQRGTDKNDRLKNNIESVLRLRFFDRVEKKLMGITIRRWNRKAKRNQRNGKGECMRLLMNEHAARPDPSCLQQKILDRFADRCRHWQVQDEMTEKEPAHFFRKEII